jgi:hypothetical protein
LGRIVTAAFAWGAVAFVGAKLDWATQDLATSSRAIALQQVKLGRWARRTLPRDAVIGVNDTGAIAYVSHRRTFDVVGLTTPGEARYWAYGAGSRFEHYERLPVDELPSFFIVYPNWMAMDDVLGPKLTEATVYDQSILGGRTMNAYEARWDRLHSGALPTASRPPGALRDELDVADVESEEEHGYRLGDALARHDVVDSVRLADGRTIVDGGRRERSEDRFTMAAGPEATLVLRVTGDGPWEIAWEGGSAKQPRVVDRGKTWRELAADLPASDEGRVITVRSRSGSTFSSWHYWLYDAD